MSDDIIPSDDELLSIYAKGTGSEGGFVSAYDGWAALYLAGYRSGALVRPNVESDASNVGQAWTEYYHPGMSSEEAQAFQAGYAYGKRAVPASPLPVWVWPTAIATSIALGFVSALVVSWFAG